MGRRAKLVRWRRRALRRLLSRDVAMACRAAAPAASESDRAVGRRQRSLSRIRLPGRHSRDRLHSDLVEEPHEARPQSEICHGRGFPRRARRAIRSWTAIGARSSRRWSRSRCRPSFARAGRIRACIRAARSRPSRASARSRNGSTPMAARNGRPITAPKPSRRRSASSTISSRARTMAGTRSRRCVSNCATPITSTSCATSSNGRRRTRSTRRFISTPTTHALSVNVRAD